jgi:hypothetical protein
MDPNKNNVPGNLPTDDGASIPSSSSQPYSQPSPQNSPQPLFRDTPPASFQYTHISPVESQQDPITTHQQKDHDALVSRTTVEPVTETKEPGIVLKLFVLVLLLILLVVGIVLPLKIIPSISSSLGPTLSAFFNSSKKVTGNIGIGATTTNMTKTNATSTLATGTSATGSSTSTGIRTTIIATSTSAISTSTSGNYTWTPYTPAPHYYQENPSQSSSTQIAQNNGTTSKNSASQSGSYQGATAGYAEVPGGLPNLAVIILNTGYETAPGGQFIPASPIPYGQIAAVQFEVVNQGNAASGQWSFIASLPSIANPTFVSNPEPSLAPGGRIVFTLGFQGLNQNGPDTATITVNPGENFQESNRTDNTASVTLTPSQSYYVN